MEERRHAPRIPLDAPCLLVMLVNYEEEHSAMVVDVSQGGVQLALSPAPGLSEITPGMPVTLQNVPAPLDNLLEGVHGKIAWVGARCCGVKLNKDLPIDPSCANDFIRL